MSERKTRISNSSCSSYAVEWRPARRSRRAVFIVAGVLLLLGLLLILHSGLPAMARVLATCSWLVGALRSIRRQVVAQDGCDRLEIRADGSGFAGGPPGTPLRLLPGSLLLGRVAWLRFEMADGRRFGELVTAADLAPANWRRLNLLWRHGLIP